MTADLRPTHEELHAAVKKFRNEAVNNLTCTPDQTRALKSLTLEPPEQLAVLKDGSRSLVGSHTLDDGTDCVLKYYYPKNIAKKINYGLRGSRAMRSWIAARAFEYLKIPTPSAMMISETKSSSKITLEQSFLACHLAKGIPLSSVTETSRLEEIAPLLQKAFDRMEAYRISHGDLKANNLIITEDNRIYFIDLDGTHILSSEKRWTKHWQRDRLRFIKNWPESSPARKIFSGVISTV
ncbi:MAG: lipopolysaccharide kinase InaA family protein [Akkermansiaceae bacterium]